MIHEKLKTPTLNTLNVDVHAYLNVHYTGLYISTLYINIHVGQIILHAVPHVLIKHN